MMSVTGATTKVALVTCSIYRSRVQTTIHFEIKFLFWFFLKKPKKKPQKKEHPTAKKKTTPNPPQKKQQKTTGRKLNSTNK